MASSFPHILRSSSVEEGGTWVDKAAGSYNMAIGSIQSLGIGFYWISLGIHHEEGRHPRLARGMETRGRLGGCWIDRYFTTCCLWPCVEFNALRAEGELVASLGSLLLRVRHTVGFSWSNLVPRIKAFCTELEAFF